MTQTDWKALVVRHARETGVSDLPPHTIDELAAHLEDIYTEARQAGRTEADAPAAGTDGARRIAAFDRAEVAHAPARIASVGGRRARRRPDRLRRRRAFCAPRSAGASPSFAAIAIVNARPRRRRRDGHLQHCRHRAAAAAALPPAGAARRDLGQQRREGAAERAPVAGQLHGLPRARLGLLRCRGVVAARSEPRGAGHGARAGQRRRDERRTSFSCSACRPQLGPGFPQDGPLYSRDSIAVISDRLWRQRYNADPGVIGKTSRASTPASTDRGRHAAAVHISRTTSISGCACTGICAVTAAARTSWRRSRG